MSERCTNDDDEDSDFKVYYVKRHNYHSYTYLVWPHSKIAANVPGAKVLVQFQILATNWSDKKRYNAIHSLTKDESNSLEWSWSTLVKKLTSTETQARLKRWRMKANCTKTNKRNSLWNCSTSSKKIIIDTANSCHFHKQLKQRKMKCKSEWVMFKNVSYFALLPFRWDGDEGVNGSTHRNPLDIWDCFTQEPSKDPS